MGLAYYNENDPYAAQWLRNLIAAGLIAPGDVDDRSITEVRPDDLRGYTQCHFFAGIAGWSQALRLAGWSDDRPVWTGSCPCQPFSVAGKRKGFEDDRHLWPVWFDLIKVCRPPVVFGEQVAAASSWLGLVRGDLEGVDYAVGCMPIEAASAGADHLRDRLWFVADSDEVRCGERSEAGGFEARPIAGIESGNLGLADGRGSQAGQSAAEAMGHRGAAITAGSPGITLGDAGGQGSPLGSIAEEQRGDLRLEGAPVAEAGDRGFAVADATHQQQYRAGTPGPQRRDEHSDGGSDVEWVIGADGKARRVKSGIRLLAHGVPARVGKLRAFGNAIDPRPAAAFITAAFPDLARAA